VTDQVSEPSRPDLWLALHSASPVPAPKGKALFRAGEPPTGIYLVEEGEVRLFLETEAKSAPVFDVAGPGSILGLSEAVTGGNYKLTAEPITGARINFVEREAFLRFLYNDHQLCLHIVRLLSADLHSLYVRCRCAPGSGSHQGSSTTVN